MKRPLLPVALLYIGGILCGEYAHPPLPVLFGASFLAAALALAFSARSRLAVRLACGIDGMDRRLLARRDSCARRFAFAIGPAAGRDAFARRSSGACPHSGFSSAEGGNFAHSSALIEANGIFIGDTWQPAFGKVIATVPGDLSSNFFEGQSVEVAGVIHPPDGPLAQGLFDARAYYARQGVFYQLQAASTNDFRLSGARESMRAAGFRTVPPMGDENSGAGFARARTNRCD